MATTNQNSPRPRRRKKPLALRIIGGLLGGIFKTLGTLLLIGICTCAIMACFAVVYVQNSIIPQAKDVVESLEIFDVTQSSVMYYTDSKTGQLVEMLTLSGAEERDWVRYEDIPEELINATIAIEDKRFRTHQGVDWKRTAAGLVYMFTGQDIQGGSTITQQLIKNMTQYDDVTVKRKILEIFTALEFEKSHSKNEILEWYLNYIYLGERCYGVSAAALNYFGKELQDLTLEECASLISITNNPSVYNPYRYPENNLRRRNLCLDQMALEENGFITQAECDAAKAQPLNLKRETGTNREQEIYTWYEDQVIDEVIEDLMEEYGITKEYASNLLYYGGLRIETCFDPEVQAYLDAVYSDRSVLELDSKTGQQIQSGCTIVDNRTGHVVAIVGGIGEKEENRGWSRAYDTKRAPGSSIKPLAVYAPALDLGLITPATVFDDIPVLLLDDEGVEVPLDTYNSEDWDSATKVSAWPKNSYSYFKGLTTVYEALEDSVNTIAVRILRDLVTPEIAFQYLESRFGISSLESGRWVNDQYKTDLTLSLALGGITNGVSTYDMAAAYSVFANNGMYTEPTTYTRVVAVDIDGNETVLLEHNSTGVAVLQESTVYYINTMLENVIDAGTGTVANFEGMTIAGKTGTTTANMDKWFVGYSPYYTAAVWVGYDQQEKIDSSKYLAAELWKQVMEPLHADLEDIGFQEPTDLTTVTICKDSGMIASEACYADPRGSRTTKMTFVKGDQPVEYCTTHVMVQVCTESTELTRYDGKGSGVYHMAGPYCPEESVVSIGMVNYTRVRVLDTITTRDDVYLKEYLETLGMTDDPETTVADGGMCDVHVTAPYDPNLFDPNDPLTWPTDNPDYPDFSILDHTTWPNYVPPFDPEIPETWPTDDPNFNIDDPATWPVDPSTEEPEVSTDPSGGGDDRNEDDDGGFSITDWLSNWFGW